jgi:hypothetical protein
VRRPCPCRCRAARGIHSFVESLRCLPAAAGWRRPHGRRVPARRGPGRGRFSHFRESAARRGSLFRETSGREEPARLPSRRRRGSRRGVRTKASRPMAAAALGLVHAFASRAGETGAPPSRAGRGEPFPGSIAL